MDVTTSIISAVIAGLALLWCITSWIDRRLECIKKDFVSVGTCKLIHTNTSKDIDRLEKSLNDGFKSLYEKIDKLNETLTQYLTQKKGDYL